MVNLNLESLVHANTCIHILLDDVKVSEQLLDLVFYLLIVLGHSRQVDIFIEAAFGAVHVTTKFLHIKLSAQQADLSTSLCAAEEQVINCICQQCEASLQFLQSLCQQKVFRERLLRNKVLDLLKTALIKDPKHLLSCSDRTCPMGLLQLNAMRLADIFSDDSNFRSYIIACFTGNMNLNWRVLVDIGNPETLPIVEGKIYLSVCDHPEDVKAMLKFWAQAVACTVKLCS
ncbi:hypothetical protein Q3G72_022254 [Acer saccharum]|nr:hypothetical protein Q3G72_022254 [Acer saccharum]